MGPFLSQRPQEHKLGLHFRQSRVLWRLTLTVMDSQMLLRPKAILRFILNIFHVHRIGWRSFSPWFQGLIMF